ncbi:MAG: hypothetical protein K2O60_04780 [Ruminococcus sp.]|nr:hypothetical protein [Ruminococcus sp.]
MKLKKIISVLTASAVVATTLPVYAGLSAFAEDTDETGNTMFTAVDIILNDAITGKIDDYSDEDWYKFTLSTAGKLIFAPNIFGEGNVSASFQIINETDDNKVIDKRSNVSGILRYTYYLTAGDYYINLSHYGMSYELDYEAKLSFTPYESTFDGANNNSITKASEIELEKNYSSFIVPADSKDYYTFNLDKDDDIALNFEGDISAIDWTLYNNKNEEILNGTYTRDAEISDLIVKNNYVSLKSGKYTLAFNASVESDFPDTTYYYGSYNFSLSEYVDFEANGISIGDFNNDGMIDASDASTLLEYYSYLSTGGDEKDMRKWLESQN